jgi:RNA recognition motif-containing protein
MKLFVGNLPWAATEESLKEFFGQVGEVVSVKIITDPYTGRSRGFGFVEMKNQDLAQEAMNKLNEVLYLDRSIRVSMARQEGQQSGGGAGGSSRPPQRRREGAPRGDGNRGGSMGGERRSFNRTGSNRYESDEE